MAEDTPRLTLAEAREKAEEFKARARNMREKFDKQVDVAVTAGVTMGTAGLIGMVEGYNRERLKIGSMDGAAVLCVAAHGFALTSGSKYEDQLHAAGNGAGCVWAYNAMKAVGERMRTNKDQGKPLISGAQDPAQLGPGQPSYYGGSSAIVPAHGQAAE